MANPFEDTGDGDTAAADAALLEKFKSASAAATGEGTREPPPEPVEPSADGTVEMELDQGERPTRQDKKANRFKEATDRADALETKNRALEADLAAERAASRRQPPPPSTPVDDPVETELTETYRQREALGEEYNAHVVGRTLTDENRRSMADRGRKLEERSQSLVFQREQSRLVANRNPQADTMAQLEARHPDVMQDQRARDWANGRAQQRRAEGEKFDFDLVDSVMNETREKFKMGKYRSGAANEGSFTSLPSAGGAPPAAKQTSIKMTPGMQALANNAYPHIKNERERFQHWATKVGPNFLERERRDGR